MKEKGKISDLRAVVGAEVQGTIGIGHTRWSTHGVPSDRNAHPQSSSDGRFYLVHNGVLDNHEELKSKYLSNIEFKSETDTEVAVQFVAYLVDKEKMSVLNAFRKMVRSMQGLYAFLMIDREDPDKLYVAKNKSPLLIGAGGDFNVVCSDSLAMLDLAHEFLELKDGIVSKESVQIFDLKYQEVSRSSYQVEIEADAVGKGTYPYFMLKEIDEQPGVIR